MTRYVSAEKMHTDDFGVRFTGEENEVVYDAATKVAHYRLGPWATMTEKSFKTHGYGKLGLGFGQKYVRNEAGELWKVEG